MAKIYQYFVEGECEEKLINTLKHPKVDLLVPGKVSVFNVVQKQLSAQRIVSIQEDTNIILVYDIDKENTDILDRNINYLKENGYRNIYHVQSISNFEEEIVYSTSLKDIRKMFNTNSISEFKSKFIRHGDLYRKLLENDFNIDKMWSRKKNNSPFSKYLDCNGVSLIKNKRSK